MHQRQGGAGNYTDDSVAVQAVLASRQLTFRDFFFRRFYCAYSYCDGWTGGRTVVVWDGQENRNSILLSVCIFPISIYFVFVLSVRQSLT